MAAPRRDWLEWHRAYDDPGTPHSRRLLVVQRCIREALDLAPAGPLRVVSMCAGEGRDLLGALEDHPRRADVHARLVELDEQILSIARASFAAAGIDAELVAADAALTDAYLGAVPAHLVLVCGVFGNIPDADVARTIAHLPGFCAPAATVVWTRHRRPPDLTPRIREWFARAGFDEIVFEAPPDERFGVGAHRLRTHPVPLTCGVHLFDFVR
ncbi:MAG TPA: SAM-dependent methyltransferase [Candidatus Eisenbacteria bacterium]|nr:SAM-dependent methyltransferase [Candidatus Eisenbacteria bacterium]